MVEQGSLEGIVDADWLFLVVVGDNAMRIRRLVNDPSRPNSVNHLLTGG